MRNFPEILAPCAVKLSFFFGFGPKISTGAFGYTFKEGRWKAVEARPVPTVLLTG